RSGPGRSEPDPPLPAEPEDGRAVRRRQGGRRLRADAGEEHRSAPAGSREGGTGPLHRHLRDARGAGQVAPHDHRSHVGLRRVREDVRGQDPVRRHAAIALSTLALAAVPFLPAHAANPALLWLAPALLRLLALLRGIYPGEKALARRLARGRRRRSRRRTSPPPPRRGRFVCLPRGGVLLATGLAGRAPPRTGSRHLAAI